MTIGIILYPYGMKQTAGLTETIYRFCESFSELPHDHKIIFFVRGFDCPIPPFATKRNYELRPVPPIRFWLDKAFTLGQDIDVWIYNMPILPFFHTPKKSIIIAADFGYLDVEEKTLRSFAVQKMLHVLNYYAFKRASHTVTISEFTRQQALRLFPNAVSGTTVTTVMAGYRDIQGIPEEPLSFVLPEIFYLSLGVIKPRKNQLKTVTAFLKAKAEGLEGSFIICGKGSDDYVNQIKQLVATSPYRESVIFAGYLTDGQVAYVYKRARALVFVSNLEGFGFPVLEAMSMGVPVITSNTTSLIEVAGEAAVTVNPESVPDIAAALLLMQDDSIRKEYILRGENRLKEFSWEKTSAKVLQIIENL